MIATLGMKLRAKSDHVEDFYPFGERTIWKKNQVLQILSVSLFPNQDYQFMIDLGNGDFTQVSLQELEEYFTPAVTH